MVFSQTGNPEPHKHLRITPERGHVFMAGVHKFVLVIWHQRLRGQIKNQLGLFIHRPIHTNPRFFAAGGAFGYFSAVCWIFGREVFDALGGNVPIGLINNNWGGTALESWSTPESLQACN